MKALAVTVDSPRNQHATWGPSGWIHSLRLVTVLLTILSLGSFGLLTAQSTALSVSNGGAFFGNLIAVDLSDGQVAVVGPLGLGDAQIVGLAVDAASDNRLFAVDAIGDQLLSIDMSTGAAAVIGALGIDAINGGLAVDGAGELLYADWDRNLYRLDRESGLATVVGSTGSLVAALAYHGDTLFGVTFRPLGNSLATIDPESGALSPVGELSFNAPTAAAGLSSDGSGLRSVEPSTAFLITSRLHSVDPETAEIGNGLTVQNIVFESLAVVTSVGPRISSGGVLSAASFTGPRLAAESWVSLFGINLADELIIGDASLPTELGGIQVVITDSAGVEHLGRLQFVSSAAINFLMPAGVAEGQATIRVFGPNGGTPPEMVEIAAVAPALFAANENGAGPAAATFLTVDSDNMRMGGLTFDGEAPAGQRRNRMLGLGAETDQVFLSLFGTGFRAQATAACQIGGLDVPLLGAIAQGEFDGLDQANLGPLPRELAGRGDVEIECSFDGVMANVVTVALQ